MNVATMGLWFLTPKKSEYKEIQKGSTTYHQVKTCVCHKCGARAKIKGPLGRRRPLCTQC